MTEAEQAALDLLREMQQMLVDQHDASARKDSEIASLTAQLTAMQAQPASDEAWVAVAQVKEWFLAFRNAVAPVPAAPSEPAAEATESVA
jgi:hypothetical protein